MFHFQKRKLLLKAPIVFLLMLCMCTYCFSQNDDLKEEQPIEFSFTTKTFDKILPFDQIFSIKLKDIPSDVNNIIIKIQEYDLGNIKFPKGSIVDPSVLKKSSIIYESEEWHRPSGSIDNTTEIDIPYKLSPNKKYIINIVNAKETKLTDSEKHILENRLKGDSEIKNIINYTSLEYLNNPKRPPDYSSLNVTQVRFNEIANRAVLKVDREYRVFPVDPVSQLFDLTKFINGFVNVMDVFENLKTDHDISVDTNKVTINREINNFREQLKRINWGSVTSADNNFNNLTTIKDKIFSAISKKPITPSMESKKQSIETFIGTVLDNRDAWINSIVVNTIAANTFKLSTINSTFRTDFVKNAKLYISLDVGAAYVWRMDRVLSYSGANIYFRPVNKNIPLREYSGWEWFTVRSSLLLGISLTSFEKANVRKGMFGNSALVTGVGFRPNPFLKINGGFFMYYSYLSNPLKSQNLYQTTFSPFISLSVDIDTKPLFSGIGEAIFK